VSDFTLKKAVMNALAARRMLDVHTIDRREDTQTEEAVRQTLADDYVLRGADIEVDVHDGNVRLSGLVEFPRYRGRAERVALGVPGVARVDNRLKVLAGMPMDELELRINQGDGQTGRGV
jgi:osmotically-inducible protein OsmY